MAAPRAAEYSAVRTGLNHLAMSVGVFLGATLLILGGAAAFGNPESAGPRIDLALFPPGQKPKPTPGGQTDEPSNPSTAVYFGDGEIDPLLEAAASTDPLALGTLNGATDLAASVVIPRSLPKAPLPGLFERTSFGDLPRVGADGVTPAQAYARAFIPNGQPRVSLIVGGLGLKASHTLAAINDLPPEVTLSFVPYADDLQVWIDKAREAGHETLIELPMEPYDYPNVDPGPQTLLTSATAQENTRRLNVLLGRTTGYFGVTNYQGAKFVTDRRALMPVLSAVSARGLVFVHDGAATRSAFSEAAAASKTQVFAADRILDAEPSADAIDRELLQLEALAVQKGKALGVGFAYPVTIEQFRLWTAELKAKGYQLAPASSFAEVKTTPPTSAGQARP